MDPVDQYSYFTLGAALSELEKLRPEAAVKFSSIFFTLLNANGALDEFDRSPCVHSKGAAKDIAAAINSIVAIAQVEKEDGKKELDFSAELQPLVVSWT
jgi:hypothetical protein